MNRDVLAARPINHTRPTQDHSRVTSAVDRRRESPAGEPARTFGFRANRSSSTTRPASRHDRHVRAVEQDQHLHLVVRLQLV